MATIIPAIKESMSSMNWKGIAVILGIVALILLGVFKTLETLIIYTHPATDTSYLNRLKIKKNVHTKKTKITKPSGEIIETEETTDLSSETSSETGHNTSSPVFKPGATLFLSGGYSLKGDIGLGLGLDVFMIRIRVSHPVPRNPLDTGSWSLNPSILVDIPLL